MASIIEFFSLGNLAIQSPCENLTILPKFVEKDICSRNLMYFIFDLFMDLVSWIDSVRRSFICLLDCGEIMGIRSD